MERELDDTLQRVFGEIGAPLLILCMATPARRSLIARLLAEYGWNCLAPSTTQP